MALPYQASCARREVEDDGKDPQPGAQAKEPVVAASTRFAGTRLRERAGSVRLDPWSGVLQPVNPNGSSVFKLGRTVPIKFRLTGASAEITGLQGRLYVAKISNDVVGSEEEATSTAAATSGNLFRYDTASGQYVFNLNTQGATVGTYRLRIDLGDGQLHTVDIGLR